VPNFLIRVEKSNAEYTRVGQHLRLETSIRASGYTYALQQGTYANRHIYASVYILELGWRAYLFA